MKKKNTLILLPLLVNLYACATEKETEAIKVTEAAKETEIETSKEDTSHPETNDETISEVNTDTTGQSFLPSSFVAKQKVLPSKMVFNYYLYTPENAKENLPLILYLHGGSGKPTASEGDLTLLTAGDGLPKFTKDGQVKPSSYIVFPQLPYGKSGWADVKEDLKDFLTSVADDVNADDSKISITGHSMGGKGTWDISISYPDLFYKVAPLSGKVDTNEKTLTALKDKPVWAFVGTEDKIVPPQSSIDYINALSKTNAEAKITIIEGYTHFDVPNVYLSDEYDLLKWLVD